VLGGIPPVPQTEEEDLRFHATGSLEGKRAKRKVPYSYTGNNAN
jgi:hypothetical protein